MERVWKHVLFLLATVLLSLTLAILSTWYIWIHQTDSPPLPDILLDILPDLSSIEFPIVNIIVLVQYVLGIISFPGNTRIQYAAQFIFLQCVLTSLRAVTTASTTLPNLHVYAYCKERPDNFFQVLYDMVTHGTCADYMFSGHTATSLLVWLFTYRHATTTWYKWVVGILVDTVIVFLLLQRWHYTMDILVATIITWLLFVFYKRYENTKHWWYFHAFVLDDRALRNLNMIGPDQYGRTQRLLE